MKILKGDAEQVDRLFPAKHFRLTLGSPPYLDARAHSAKKLDDWVSWMCRVTLACLRVTDGPVLWVVAGTGGVDYQPGPEKLVSRMHYAGVKVLRPNIWTKNAPPSGKHWFSNDWEYVLAFARKVPLPVWNPQALATPMKYTAGGHFRQRKKDGTRSRGGDYPQHALRQRPSNVHHVTVGGGHLGWDRAHENDAPYPEKLVEPFIKALTRPGDRVLDPFCGSGTTPAVAELLGREGFGVDLRDCQVKLARARQKDVNRRKTAPLPGVKP